MPSLETVEALAEHLADMLGVSQQHLRFAGMSLRETRALREAGDVDHDHAQDCGCRQCWCGHMEDRIRQAVRHETQLRRGALPQGGQEAGK